MRGLRPLIPFLCAWISACAAPAAPSAPPEPSPALSLAPAEDPRPPAERLAAFVAAEQPDGPYAIDAELAARARSVHGLDEDALIELLTPRLHHCQRSPDLCKGALPDEQLAIALLGELAGHRGVELLATLAAWPRLDSEDALERALSRRALAEIGAVTCEPPSAAEVELARAELADFRVLDADASGHLLAREPDPATLDDLAYLYAALAETGPPIGSAREDHETPAQPGRAATLDELFAQWERARAAGQLRRAYTKGRAYLDALGWPGELRVNDQTRWSWGGGAHAYLMRELAVLAEALARPGAAVQLWARANPGGGRCGTSTSAHWREQVRGFIRAGEAVGGCRMVVAERLLAIDARHFYSFGDDQPQDLHAVEPGTYDYGVQRLVDAGFELDRLYRGALATRNRDLDPAELAAKIVGPERATALARLEARGREAWEARLHAAPGLADTLGEAALPLLLDQIAHGLPETQRRAVEALGESARRPLAPPCVDDQLLGGGYISSRWTRAVTPFAYDCATILDNAEVAELSRALVPLLQVPDEDMLYSATLTALTEILAFDALPALRQARAAPLPDPDYTWKHDELDAAIEALEQARNP